MSVKLPHLLVPIAGALVLLGLTAPASGEQSLFEALDSDRDGVLSQHDVAPLANVIRLLDQDHSDTITLDEFRTRVSYADVKLVEEDFYIGDLTPEDWHKMTSAQQGAAPEELQIVSKSLIQMDLTNPGEVRFVTRQVSYEDIAKTDFVRVEFIAPES